MESDAPPPVIGCGRVISYAIVPDDLEFVERWTLFSGDVRVGRVPRLAICQQFEQMELRDFLLELCDEDWSPVSVTGAATVNEVKRKAEANYPGIAKHWVDLNTSEEEAIKYYDETWPESICAGCGRHNFEFDEWLETEGKGYCIPCYEAANGHVEP